ncbi:putative mediator of RNA polymerase II transcription subunit 12 [Uranotaenia lowii]|uniref:putative mediator of RNA polymerase II transcription subunit 12 n=1 Tax=Uranotaenia lowii TaxID=190385 RepID=UPI00247A06BF|nr:putative mediator of RNA polymerase II transcription subunit 12 [Uranotaenia lowii]
MQWMERHKMRFLCVFVLLLAAVMVKADSTSSSSGDTKEVDSDVKRIRIDPALRKALLRALRHLKERQEEEDLLNDSNTTEENYATTLLDEILEESTSPDRNLNYHSYTVGDAKETKSDDNEIIKTIIITKPKTTLSPPKEDPIYVPDPIKERENDIDSNQVARSVSSGLANQLEDGKGEKVSFEKPALTTVDFEANSTPEFTTTLSPVTMTTTTAAATTTVSTTTTEAPTHNDDGENIEKVKHEDVKIYQAPLVAAFTVQQDQLGVPRNVIPLLQALPSKNPVEFNPSTPIATSSTPAAQAQPVFKGSQTIAPVVTPVPINTHALEEKTRLLEQQLIALQTQQRIQEQLLRSKILQEQQLILQQQQQLQQQRLRLEEETRLRLQKFDEEQRLFRQQQQQLQIQQQQLKIQQQQQQQLQQQPQIIPIPLHQQQPPQQQQQLPQKQQLQQFNPPQSQPQPPIQPPKQVLPPPPQPQFIQELPRNSPAVQFIPSIALPGKSIPISVEQQLPFKEPVDFQLIPSKSVAVEQIKSISPPAVQQFSIIPPSPPQLSKQQLLPLKPFQPFNINAVPLSHQPPLPLDQQLPNLQRTRVFRQESSTANFGLNPQPPQSNAPFRPSQPIPILQQQPNNNPFGSLRNDNQLQNLLLQSGITSRSAEDFNIITKVLALNHGIPQSSSQLMFAKLSPEQQQQLLFRK